PTTPRPPGAPPPAPLPPGPLPAAAAAVAAFADGGTDGEERRAEAVRIAALIESHGLGRTQAAVARLDEAAARCARAGLSAAAQLLASVREDLAAGATS
ncbi:hypothetical protein AB8B12_33365, partial [Streptomyces sp. PGLac3x]